jgi:hypothetical protein
MMARRGFPPIVACFLSVAAAGGGTCWAQAGTAAGPAAATADATATRVATDIRRAKVAALVTDAQKFYDVKQYRDAADLLRQATIIDPQDEQAAVMLRIVMNKITDMDYERVMSRTKAQFPETQPATATHSPTPYPAFTVTTDRRATEGTVQESAANRAVRDRLEENLKEITTENAGFAKVINFLSDNMGVNIFIDWTALATVNVERNSPITVSLKEVPFRKALQTVLSQVSGDKVNLCYTIDDDGIITITTKEAAARFSVVKVFDIRDLLAATLLEIPGTASRPATSTAPATDIAKLRQQAIENIIETITKTVAPDTWKPAERIQGAIREKNGQLIVYQTQENQAAIAELIHHLRETRTPKIALDVRIFLVSNVFLDDFRVGWNIDPTSSARSSPPEMPPQRTGVPGSYSPVYYGPPYFAASIIDAWTVTLLLQAAEADKRTISLAAPRCMVYEGMRGQIACTTARRYVRGYTADARRGQATAYAPDYMPLETGLTVGFDAAVSEDRKAIVTHLELTQEMLRRIEQAPAPDVPEANKLMVDKPVVITRAGDFTLNIPDGGTAIFGAQRVPAGFLQDSDGAPDPNAGKDTQSMLILLHAKVMPPGAAVDNELRGATYVWPNGLPALNGATRPATRP